MWGGLFFVAQTLGQALSPLVADNFGRKISMYILNVFMLLVSLALNPC